MDPEKRNLRAKGGETVTLGGGGVLGPKKIWEIRLEDWWGRHKRKSLKGVVGKKSGRKRRVKIESGLSGERPHESCYPL